MSTITLYDCNRLHARITLASCEANRAKSDTIVALSEDVNLAVRPYPCRNCTDWQTWNSNNAMEVDVTNIEPAEKALVCSECSAETPRPTKGLCRKCYQRQNRAEHKTKQAASAPAPVVQQEAPQKPATCTKIHRIYLACPYTSTEAAVMEQRRIAATSAANALLQQGYNVFSPISHGAEVGKGLPPDFAFWGTSCLSFVEHWATDVYVLMLPGWEASVGITAEVNAARALNIQVTHILPLPCSHAAPMPCNHALPMPCNHSLPMPCNHDLSL